LEWPRSVNYLTLLGFFICTGRCCKKIKRGIGKILTFAPSLSSKDSLSTYTKPSKKEVYHPFLPQA
jgi:hypothetical protein